MVLHASGHVMGANLHPYKGVMRCLTCVCAWEDTVKYTYAYYQQYIYCQRRGFAPWRGKRADVTALVTRQPREENNMQTIAFPVT